MKWATVELDANREHRLVFVEENTLVDIHRVYRWHCTKHRNSVNPEHLSSLLSLNALLEANMTESDVVKNLRDDWLHAMQEGDESAAECRLSPEEGRLVLPFQPTGFRDFYAFERHVATCRSKRGLEMVPEWYDIPVFYFSNPRSFVGAGNVISAPEGCRELDFELEIACVIGKSGSSIPESKALEHIAGYAILNDWSARDIQRREMRVGLGPAKGKDFATSLGPYLVTPEELEQFSVSGQPGVYDLSMTATVNGKKVSSGNFRDIHYTFAQMIERASRDTVLVPGEVIGSGTVGTGCILELGTDVQPWLKPGDCVELEIAELGVLRNTIGNRG